MPSWQVLQSSLSQVRIVLSNYTTAAEQQLTTTEIHCSEFYPGITDEEYTTTYAESYGLATTLLNQYYEALCAHSPSPTSHLNTPSAGKTHRTMRRNGGP